VREGKGVRERGESNVWEIVRGRDCEGKDCDGRVREVYEGEIVRKGKEECEEVLKHPQRFVHVPSSPSLM
jgi:hypothetical protein